MFDPHPVSDGFLRQGFDGRIDDRMWAGRPRAVDTNGDRTPWLMKGGKGSRPRAVHIPDAA